MAENIGFVGGGNMATAMLGGLIANGVKPDNLRASDPAPANREELASRLGVTVYSDNEDLASWADIVVLAVKPQVIEQVSRQLRTAVQQSRPLVLSVAAGIETGSIENWLGGDVAVVRAMPNSPCLLRQGITALHANRLTDNGQRALAQRVLEAVGTVVWLDREDLMDAVTAVSGSGPAYYFLFMEAMEHCARQMGLPMEVSWALIRHTGIGATRMALESGRDLAQLRRDVTSPGGTTAAALEVFEQAGFREMVERALSGARDRGRELSREFGKP